MEGEAVSDPAVPHLGVHGFGRVSFRSRGGSLAERTGSGPPLVSAAGAAVLQLLLLHTPVRSCLAPALLQLLITHLVLRYTMACTHLSHVQLGRLLTWWMHEEDLDLDIDIDDPLAAFSDRGISVRPGGGAGNWLVYRWTVQQPNEDAEGEWNDLYVVEDAMCVALLLLLLLLRGPRLTRPPPLFLLFSRQVR